MRYTLLLLALLSAATVTQADTLQEIHYISSADDTKQPAMFHVPTDTETPVPLVVALHTWSGNYQQNLHQAIAAWCIEKGWAYIHPDFRGPNKRPEATGSRLVIEDIVSAVAYAQQATRIDPDAVFLVGTSGGGYTALLMAGHYPKRWAGVSAWVPISDLTAWHRECKAAGRKYFKDIAASCGGAPGTSPAIDREYAQRSPLTHLAKAQGLRLHINAGIHDGHKGSVPISHSLHAFNAVAAASDRLSDEEITYFVDQAAVPPKLRADVSDPSYGKKNVLFRRTSGAATITLFEGGHELVAPAAVHWIEQVYRTSR